MDSSQLRLNSFVFFSVFICTSLAMPFLSCAQVEHKKKPSFFLNFFFRESSFSRSSVVFDRRASPNITQPATANNNTYRGRGRGNGKNSWVKYVMEFSTRIYWIFNHQMFGFAFNLTIWWKIYSGISHILLHIVSRPFLPPSPSSISVTFRMITHFRTRGEPTRKTWQLQWGCTRDGDDWTGARISQLPPN